MLLRNKTKTYLVQLDWDPCQTYNSENMTTINFNDTLPLTTENSNEKVIELSDDEKTY